MGKKVVCPKCEKDDQIQKVISIFTGGVSTSVHELHGALYNSATSTSQTALSKRLSPPAKPKSRSDYIKEILAPSGCISMVVGFVLWAFMIGCVASVFVPPDAVVSVGFWGALVTIGLLTAAILASAKDDSDWERMIATKYGELYYCYRDDCVFDPRTNKYTSPEGMKKLLE